MDERARIFVETRKRTQGIQRASQWLFFGIVVVILTGMLIGLAPEIAKSRALDLAIKEEQTLLAASNRDLRRSQIRHDRLLSRDIAYTEMEFRRLQPRAAKPGEILLMLSDEQIRAYEAEDRNPTP